MTDSLQDAHPSGKDTSATPTKKRSKFREFFGMSKSKPADKVTTAGSVKPTGSPSTAPCVGSTPDAKGRAVDSSVSKDIVVHTTPVAGPRLDIFLVNVAKPILRTDLPKKQERIEKTPQLVYSISLLPKDGSLLSPATVPQNQETSLEEEQRAWLKAMEQDPIEQDHIRWLGTRMIEEFIKDPSKDSVEISEIVLLGPVLQKEHYRRLLSCTIAEFEKSLILDVDLLQGLVQLLQSASPGFLVSDDLVKILSILRTRLQGTHQQSTEHPYHLTLAVSRVLDIMAEHEVQDLDRVLEHEPLSGVLSGLRGSSDPYLMYQACYAFQALQYVPDDETALQAVLRHSSGVVDGLVKISGVFKLDLGSILEGLGNLQEALGSTIEIADSVYEGFCSLRESGRGVLDSLKEGLGAGQKRPWYAALRAAYAFVKEGQLADLNRFIYEAPCRRDPLFQWGVCQLLGEIASDTIWDSTTRQHAVDLLGALFKDDGEWGQDEGVKTWMTTIVIHLGGVSEQRVCARAHALLRDIKKEQESTAQLSYPLRAHLPIPSSSPILARVQDIPYVEYDLHTLQLQQLEEGQQAVYIPPQAKPSLQAKDEDIFPLMEKVQGFLGSERQVMLILGDSGAGKSTFNRHLEHELWTNYKQGGPIPLFINLPAIDRPDQGLIGKQLKLYNFKDDQIQELKQHRQIILICDGYDESQLQINLHRSNLLNHPGQWNTKMVISCRTQFLGPTYLDRFQPQPSDQYASNTIDLFQQVVIAPFTKDQIDEYVDQFRNSSSTQLLFGDEPVWSTKEYMDKLAAIPNLMELVKNPFLLTLALKTLPKVVETKQDLSSIRITRVSLYDKFVTQWLEINMRRLQNSNLSNEEHAAFNLLKDDGFIRCGIDYMKSLSAALFKEQNGNPAVQYSHLKEKRTWKAEFFTPDPEVRLLREASPLARTGNLYRFIHRSVMEYFYSCMVYDPNANDPDDEQFAPHPTSSSTDLLDPISEHPLSQRSLVAEPSIVQFLAERVQSSITFKDQLLAIIELSKTDAQASQAAANAITILVRAKVRFNASDLRGIRIPGADLSGGQFDSAQFQRADLTGANLTRSWIRQADFSNARMEETHFGELPYLKGRCAVNSCTYSPDGKTFAVGFNSKDINIYDTTSWTIIHQFVGHKDSVCFVTFSPCGKHLLSGSDDNTARLWDCQTKELLFVLEGHSDPIWAVAYSPSGKQVASAGRDRSVRVWDPETGALIFALKDHTNAVIGLAFSPDGLWLASGSYGRTLRFHDAQTGMPGLVLDTTHGGISSIAFSPIDQQIAVGHQDGHMQLCDTTTGEILLEWNCHFNYISGVTFSTDGQWIATISHDRKAGLWDAQTGSLVSVFAGHSSPISSVAFSPDGSQLATGGHDKTMRLWELNLTGPNPDSQDKSDPVVNVAYSHDGQWIVSGRLNGVVQQYNAVTGEPGFVYQIHLDGARVIAFSPISHQFASVNATSADEVKVWNTDTGALDHVLRGHTDDIFCLSFSPCGGRIASGSQDKTIRLWDACSGTLVVILEGHTNGVTALSFSSDGRRLVSCDWDKMDRVWELATGEFRILPHPPTYYPIMAIAYSPNGQQVALSRDYYTYVIDEPTGNVLHKLFQKLSVDCLKFSPCGEWLATGGDGAMILWRSVSDGEGGQKWSQVVKIQGFLSSVARIDWRPQNSSDRLELVSGCLDGSVRVWRIVEGLDGGVSAQLVWGVGSNHLCASATGLVDVVGLSTANQLLLTQCGVIDGSESESEEMIDEGRFGF